MPASRSVKPIVVRAVVLALVFAAGVFLVAQFHASLSYGELVSRETIAPMLGAMALTSVCVVGLAVIWAWIVSRLQREASPYAGVRLFLYTWLLRYVPGTVPYHAARLMLAERIPAGKKVVAASIVYEGVLTLSACALVAVIGLFVGLGADKTLGVSYALIALPLILLPIGLHPRICLPILNRLLKKMRREPLADGALLSEAEALTALLGYAGVFTISGVAFYLLANALIAESIDPALAIGTYALSGAAGIVVVFMPSGLGVREAVIVAVLSQVTSAGDALLAAGAMRAVSLVAEVIPPLGLVGFDLVRRLVSRRAAEAAPVGFVQGRHA